MLRGAAAGPAEHAGGVGFVEDAVHIAQRHLLPKLMKNHGLEAGELVVIRAGEAGSNICAVFHPESWVRGKLAGLFRVLDFAPDGAQDSKQDAYLLQKL